MEIIKITLRKTCKGSYRDEVSSRASGGNTYLLESEVIFWMRGYKRLILQWCCGLGSGIIELKFYQDQWKWWSIHPRSVWEEIKTKGNYICNPSKTENIKVIGNIMIDCQDEKELQKFYSELLGWEIWVFGKKFKR